MKLTGTMLVGLAALGFAMSGPAHAKRSDEGLEDRIEERLEKDRALKVHGIDVEVEEGVATLSGSVPTSIERAQAEKLARGAGADQVKNDLGVSDVDADALVSAGAQPRATGTKPGKPTGKPDAGARAE
jgi:hypothetical protein